ncbi:MAG: two-component system sensor histidine kinase/response regulator [Sphingobacteriales bacterium]|jgi:two-component system sensor histidine kinase/response regulator
MVGISESIKLLILEDDEIDQMALERYFKAQNLNYDYTIVDSVANAKQLIKNNSFDVILSDHQLVDGNGTELLGKDLKIPLILVTGAGDQRLAVNAMKMGAFDYLVKDYERTYLHFIPIIIQKAISHTVQNRKFL